MDLMHLCDCHGTACCIFGGVLGLAMEKRAMGRTIADRLLTVNRFMVEWYNSHPPTHRLPELRPNNLKSNEWYELSGPAIKAAKTRAAAPLFKDFAARYFTEPTGTDTAVVEVTARYAEFYDLLYSCPMFMADADVLRLRGICEVIGVQVSRIGRPKP